MTGCNFASISSCVQFSSKSSCRHMQNGAKTKQTKKEKWFCSIFVLVWFRGVHSIDRWTQMPPKKAEEKKEKGASELGG